MTRRTFESLLLLARLGAAASLTLTVAGMLVPGSSLPQEMPSDLLLHAVGFGLPALFACFAAPGGRSLLAPVSIIALAAVASEAAQWLVPGRAVSALDLAADAVGIGCGASLGRLARLLLSEIAGVPPAPRAQS
jgi:hypothetical protein